MALTMIVPSIAVVEAAAAEVTTNRPTSLARHVYRWSAAQDRYLPDRTRRGAHQ